jgi:patatin-like phospholipase/acyl hydrolase
LIEPRKSKKIAMPELFDMISGSETGAIIGTLISLKNNKTSSSQQKNRFFADTATKFF